MKALVVEIKNEYVAVLSDDGCITKIKNNHFSIGDVIELEENISATIHSLENTKRSNRETCFGMKKGANMINKKIIMSKKFAAIASVVVIGLLGAGGAKAYFTPYTYVSLDVNPSIEYSVNYFGTVLDAEAVNDDGQAILDQIDMSTLENQPIEDAITNTVQTIAENEYFSGETDGGIMITTSSDDTQKSEELADTLKETVETQVTEIVTDNTVVVEAESVGKDRVEEAKALGVTPGKLNLVEKLIASAGDSSTISKEEWLKKPVKEIMKAIKQNKKANAINEDTDTNNTNTDATVQSTDPTATPTATTDPSITDLTEVEATDDANLADDDDADEVNDNNDADEVDDADDADEAKDAQKAEEQAKKKAEQAKELAEKKAEQAKELAEKKAEQAKKIEEKKAEQAKKQAEKKAELEKKQAEKAKEAAEKKAEQEKKQQEKKAEQDKSDSDEQDSNSDED